MPRTFSKRFSRRRLGRHILSLCRCHPLCHSRSFDLSDYLSRRPDNTRSQNICDRFAEVAHLWGDNTSLYVSETDRTIRRISLSTGNLARRGSSSECKWPYPPSNTPALADGSGTEARFGFPNAIWGDCRILYVSDGYTLRTVDPMTGETHTIASD